MKRYLKFLRNYTFVQLVCLWISLGVGFAVIYYLLSFLPQNSLLYLNKPLNHGFSDFLTIVYFSFITLTSTGYGDVVPLGFLKILAILEIFFGLAVFGFLISKLLSARQEKIIEELYDISFEEKVNKLRSALYVYRANISRLIGKIKITKFYRSPGIINELEANLEGLKTCISRIRWFLVSENKKQITKLNDLTLNLLFNSLNLSIISMVRVFELLNSKRYDWKQKNIIKDVSGCVKSIKSILELYKKKVLKDELQSLLTSIDDSLKKLEKLME